jgi:hypothetical protein
MAVFNKQVRGIQAKYKILWFVVDMHHRERYFFICSLLTDCYESWLEEPPARQRRTDNRGIHGV